MTQQKTYRIGATLQDPRGDLKDDPNLLAELQDKVSSCMTRLFRMPSNGGNPFLFALSSPKPHEIRAELDGQPFETAATDGKKFYWSPTFLKKLNVDEVATVMEHEGYHVVFFHPERMKRVDNKKVFNFAVDYVVNAVIELDREANNRRESPWGGNLGKPLLFKELLAYIDGKGELPKPPTVFADKSLHGRSPEDIYDEIMQHIQKSPRKCPTCGSLSMNPKTGKPQNKPGKQPGQGPQGQQPGQQPGQGQGPQGQQPGQGCGCGCPTCGAKPDPNGGMCGDGDGFGGLDSMDSHIPSQANKQEVMADVMRARQQALQMRGTIPSAIDDVLGELSKPVIKFTDLIRNACMRKVQDAGLNNNWKQMRRRYLPRPGAKKSTGFKGMYLPTRHTHKPRWLAMLDTSGSMGQEDMAYGISQLQCLGNTEGYVIPCDASPKWDEVTAIKDTSAESLKKVKISGRGGTEFTEVFRDYAKHLGNEFDVLICLTDGDCGQYPLSLKPKGPEVIWVLTRNNTNFKPEFGRVAHLRKERP
jgi:predicted metal-dependent peptidase